MPEIVAKNVRKITFTAYVVEQDAFEVMKALKHLYVNIETPMVGGSVSAMDVNLSKPEDKEAVRSLANMLVRSTVADLMGIKKKKS